MDTGRGGRYTDNEQVAYIEQDGGAVGKTIQVEIPDDAEEVPASEMREGRHVLDELLKGRVLIFTRFGFAVGVAAPLPGPGSPTREVKE